MGTIAELQGKPDRLYPLLWLSNEGGSLEDNYKVDNIRLTMFGRVIVGEEGQDDDASEIEVLSDMQLILLDFLNYFHQQHGQEYVTDKAATLEHFTERTNDRTAGYSCVLELKQFYDWNKCNIPQSGAVIPPTIDGLTLYDFCDQSVLDRLTAEQNACLLLEFGNCADATVENSDASYSTTVASGATLVLPNIDFTDSDGTTTSVPSVQNIVATPIPPCADATVQLNGTTVGTIPSGDSDSFTVNLDGSPSGTWDGTAWQVTSTPCADATVELNGVEMTTIPSGDTENISIRQSSGATEVGSKQGVHWRIDDSAISINGSPVADVKAEDSLDIDVTQGGSPVGSWNGSAWIVPTCVDSSISIGVFSDAGHTTPITEEQFGQRVYIQAVASYAAVSYLFIARLGDDFYFIDENGTGEVSWDIDAPAGNIEIIVIADDEISNLTGFTITGLLFDIFSGARFGFSHHQLRVAQTQVIRCVRSSDNANVYIGFTANGEPNETEIIAHVGVGNGFYLEWLDQSGNGNNATQSTIAEQPRLVTSGTIEKYLGKIIVKFDGANDNIGMAVSMPNPSTYFIVVKANSTADNMIMSSSSGSRNQIDYSSGAYRMFAGTALSGGIVNTDEHLITALFNGANSRLWVDGVLVASGNAGTQTPTRLDFGKFGLFLLNGHIKTAIGYPSDQTANRVGIEAVINAFTS
uniref:hypothetical protein n=1 Tax=Yoonia sp. TaxID=2212373 RepID=UPI0040484C0B